MVFRMRTFVRLWRWRQDLSWRRALILDTFRGRLSQRAACRLIQLDVSVKRRPVAAPGVEIRKDDHPA